MFTSDLTTATAANTDERVRRPDAVCRARARQFLVDLIGAVPDDLRWDGTHRLQGRAHLGGHELVVIAPRDEAHRTVVLTTHDWAQVRLASADQRRSLLRTCAIADRGRLAEVLGSDALLAAA